MNSDKEVLGTISGELRSMSRGALEYGSTMEPLPKAFGKPLHVYFAEVADRIDAAEARLLDEVARRRWKIQFGDECVISDRWKAVVTAATERATGQVEYQLEWVGDGELKSEWMTQERMRLLGFKVYHDGKEVFL